MLIIVTEFPLGFVSNETLAKQLCIIIYKAATGRMPIKIRSIGVRMLAKCTAFPESIYRNYSALGRIIRILSFIFILIVTKCWRLHVKGSTLMFWPNFGATKIQMMFTSLLHSGSTLKIWNQVWRFS